VSRLLAVPEFRDYMDDLHISDKDRSALVKDLLDLHEDLQVIITDARDARQAAIPVSHLGPIRRRVEKVIDVFVIFPAANGGTKDHRYVHIARRSFTEQKILVNMYFGEGVHGLGGELNHKEFDHYCVVLKKLPLIGFTDKKNRGDRGGKKKKKKKPQRRDGGNGSSSSSPSSSLGNTEQSSPDPWWPPRGMTNSRPSNRGGRNSGAAGRSTPGQSGPCGLKGAVNVATLTACHRG